MKHYFISRDYGRLGENQLQHTPERIRGKGLLLHAIDQGCTTRHASAAAL